MNDRLLPWVRAGFVVMVMTGALLFYGIPVRTYQSVWFRGKMIFLILAMLNIWYFHARVQPTSAAWDTNARLPWIARRAGLASLVLWALIIVFGRFIAYNWFDCDIQPQSAFVNWFAGCVVPPHHQPRSPTCCCPSSNGVRRSGWGSSSSIRTGCSR